MFVSVSLHEIIVDHLKRTHELLFGLFPNSRQHSKSLQKSFLKRHDLRSVHEIGKELLTLLIIGRLKSPNHKARLESFDDFR